MQCVMIYVNCTEYIYIIHRLLVRSTDIVRIVKGLACENELTCESYPFLKRFLNNYINTTYHHILEGVRWTPTQPH